MCNERMCVDNCCSCCSLRQGCFIIGISHILDYISLIIGTVIYFNIWAELPMLVFTVLLLIATLLFLYGVWLEKPLWINAYGWITLFVLLIYVVLLFYVMVVPKDDLAKLMHESRRGSKEKNHKNDLVLTLVAFAITGIAGNAYCALVIFSYSAQIRLVDIENA